MNIASQLEELIVEKVKNQLQDDWYPPLPDYNATDSLGEVIEKLVILHIRTWYLEDAIQAAQTDQEVADLKRKIDQCFKVKRPKFVAAINQMIDEAIYKGKSLKEESVKMYKGVE